MNFTKKRTSRKTNKQNIKNKSKNKSKKNSLRGGSTNIINQSYLFKSSKLFIPYTLSPLF